MIFGQRKWDDYRRWNQDSELKISGTEWAVVNFSELLLETDEKKFRFGRVSISRLAVIHEDMCCRAFWSWITDELKSSGQKDCRKSCVSSAYRWWFNDRDEIRVLRGDVYKMKSRGPRTKTWGHHISRHVRRKSSCHIWFDTEGAIR